VIGTLEDRVDGFGEAGQKQSGAMKKAVLALALTSLTAQTPASAPSSGAPLRHLEYAFSVDEEGVSEYHYNGIGNGVETGAGVGGGANSNGGRGTMYVDVLSVAADGALVVKIWELVQDQARPGQAYTCTVYGNTVVLCPSVPAPSTAQWVLLSYLGRRFVDGAPWDAAHHWQRKEDNQQYTMLEDFTMGDAGNPNLALITEKRKMTLHNGEFGTRQDEVRIVYDRSMEVPDVVHDEMQSVSPGGSGHAAFDFQLTSDSFSKAQQ
jgi:hypothetical protein